MQLRITKKEKPYMRISFAMLYPKQTFKKNDRVKHVTLDKLGRIEKIDDMYHVIYDDKTTEVFSKKEINKFLTKVTSSELSSTKTSSTKNSNKKLSRDERIDQILKEAVRKGEIEEDDIDVKKLELDTYSDEQLDEYEKQVNDSYDEDIPENEEDEEKTEAELALAALRASGKVSQQSNESSGEMTSRSLKDAKFDHEMQMQESLNFITKDNVTKDGFTLDLGLEQMKKDFEKKSHEFVRPKEHSMQNLHGLTAPVVQASKEPSSFKDRLQDIDWTILGK